MALKYFTFVFAALIGVNQATNADFMNDCVEKGIIDFGAVINTHIADNTEVISDIAESVERVVQMIRQKVKGSGLSWRQVNRMSPCITSFLSSCTKIEGQMATNIAAKSRVLMAVARSKRCESIGTSEMSAFGNLLKSITTMGGRVVEALVSVIGGLVGLVKRYMGIGSFDVKLAAVVNRILDDLLVMFLNSVFDLMKNINHLMYANKCSEHSTEVCKSLNYTMLSLVAQVNWQFGVLSTCLFGKFQIIENQFSGDIINTLDCKFS